MKNINFWKLFIVSCAVWYLGITFVRWEYDWVKHLQDLTNMDRLWFFLAFAGKTFLDYLLWRWLNKDSERPEGEQRTYHYDEDGNEIRENTSIN